MKEIERHETEDGDVQNQIKIIVIDEKQVAEEVAFDVGGNTSTPNTEDDETKR